MKVRKTYVHAYIAELVNERLPKVDQHLKEINVPLTLITLPWFLCLFIGYVPFEASLRILDCFLYEGPNILFSFALALLKMNEKIILEADEGTAIATQLKEAVKDSEQLLQVRLSTLTP